MKKQDQYFYEQFQETNEYLELKAIGWNIIATVAAVGITVLALILIIT